MQRIPVLGLIVMTAFGGLSVAGAAVAATPVFINELHYDNAGTDANEAIEIAGPVGTDLTDWSVVLYNGNDGKSYDTITLSGSIPANCADMADGVLVALPPKGQIQNGAPDGLALVNAGGVVVQFLSYEGTFTATDGPASGKKSTDIGVSEPGDSPVGESLQLTGTGSQDTDFHWNAPATSSFGTCNAGESFGAAVDVPPSVASTQPADDATGVALATNIDIHFSEAVTLAADWADLACTASGAHTFAVSGSGADYTLDPDVDFANSETCTVTVHADKVVDQDGTANAMTDDVVFDFTTVSDDPPQVLSTTPANGGSAAASSNLAVSFSEPVMLDTGWYTLVCDQSGSHTATVSGGPASYTLDPAADFTELEHCTFTIVASAVHDTDGSADALPADVVVAFGIAAAGGGDYYAGVDTSSGPALEAWLHTRLITSPQELGPKILAYPYTGSTTDTWDILNQADEDPNNPSNILDLYKNASLAKITGGQGAYNREHSWPKSLGFPDDTRNDLPNPPYTDTHMLFLTDVTYNGQRGNGLLGNCPAEASCTALWTVANNGFGGDHDNPGDANYVNGDISFEVWDHRKGDVARAVMYMAVRYDGGIDADGICEPDLRLTDDPGKVKIMDAQDAPGCTGDANIAYNGLLTDLLQWNDQDPPDDGERLRNEVVYSYQHNRNPFVDHPEWARCVFLDQGCPADNDDDIIFQDGFDTDTAAQ